jgi:hypothetical protein
MGLRDRLATVSSRTLHLSLSDAQRGIKKILHVDNMLKVSILIPAFCTHHSFSILIPVRLFVFGTLVVHWFCKLFNLSRFHSI